MCTVLLVTNQNRTAIPMRKELFLPLFLFCTSAFPQLVSPTPEPGFQSQKAISTSNFNKLLWVDGVQYTTIAAAYEACPETGGVVHVPPGYAESPFTAINAKANCGIEFDGTATLTSSSTLFTNTQERAGVLPHRTGG